MRLKGKVVLITGAASGIGEDVAYAALYLASDESKFITGIELTVDGGILAGTASSPKPLK